MLYIVYLDEFGHIGPYVSATDPQHKTHPAFGLAGLVLPVEKVRHFSTFFYQLKNNLLAYEVKKSSSHPAIWEKKGSALYTEKNVRKYPELRRATNRLFNRIKTDGGFIFYVGVEKHNDPTDSNAKGLYKQVMHEVIKRIDQECQQQSCEFMILLDQQDDMQSTNKNVGIRHEVVRGAAVSMFGPDKCRALIEPPLQAESHLYQTLQCADWICGLVGRLVRYELEPNEFPTYAVFRKYFSFGLKQICRRSSIRKKPDAPAPSPPEVNRGQV